MEGIDKKTLMVVTDIIRGIMTSGFVLDIEYNRTADRSGRGRRDHWRLGNRGCDRH